MRYQHLRMVLTINGRCRHMASMPTDDLPISTLCGNAGVKIYTDDDASAFTTTGRLRHPDCAHCTLVMAKPARKIMIRTRFTQRKGSQ